MAAGTSSLVVPPNNTPSQVFLLQSGSGGVIQLVQLPAVAAVTQSVSTRPNQQVILAPSPAVTGNRLQLFAVSSAPAANVSRMTVSVPVVQFVMNSSSNTTSALLTRTSAASSSAGSVLSSLPVSASQQPAVITSPGLITSPCHLTVTSQQPSSASSSADHPKPATQQCGTSAQQSTNELSNSSGLAQAADLFLMAASVVDRATATSHEVNRVSAAVNSALRSPSSAASK